MSVAIAVQDILYGGIVNLTVIQRGHRLCLVGFTSIGNVLVELIHNGDTLERLRGLAHDMLYLWH